MPKQQQIKQIGKPKHHRNAPTAKSCKKAPSGRGQTSEIDNHYNTFNCFPKGSEVTKYAKKEAEIEASGTQNRQTSEKNTLKNEKEQDHEKTRPSFDSGAKN